MTVWFDAPETDGKHTEGGGEDATTALRLLKSE